MGKPREHRSTGPDHHLSGTDADLHRVENGFWKGVICPESPAKETVRIRAAGTCDIWHLRSLPVLSGSWI